MRLGSNQTATYIVGVAGVNLTGTAVVITPSGQLGVASSSARYKKEIHDLNDQPDRLAQLRPVSYVYKSDDTNTTQYGLVAEEVEDVYPEIVVKNQEGQPESVQYQELIPLLVAEIQKERQIRASDRARMTGEIEALKARLDQLESAADRERHIASR